MPDQPRLELLPAVDVVGGRAVQLVQGVAGTGGDFGDPLEAALAWQEQGAQWLHLVDLDAAFGRGSNADLLARIVDVLDIAYEPQRRLYDDDGSLVGIADLFILGTKRLHEYDGAVHRDKAAHRADLRRDSGLNHADFVRRGFTLDDLLNHALVTMHEIDRDLDRPHKMRRYRAWAKLVDESLYSATGRQRLMNRWHRQMGVAEWSRTAC